MKGEIVRTLACLGGLMLTGSASAAEEGQQVVEEGWTFALAPYLWAAGLSGDVVKFGLPAVDVDSSFSDILRHRQKSHRR